jgi:hypothetical protein
MIRLLDLKALRRRKPTPLTEAQQERIERLVLEAAVLARSSPDLIDLHDYTRKLPISERVAARHRFNDLIRLRNEVDLELGRPFVILLNRRSTSRRRRKAARLITAQMSTHFASPQARAELKSMKRPGGLQKWVREEVFVPALLQAVREQQEQRQPRTVRIGSKWVTDASGRKARLYPIRVDDVAFFKKWLITRARAISEEMILGGPRLKHLSPKQRKLLLLLQSGDNKYQDAAERMGLTPEAVRQLATRARAKPRVHESPKRSPRRHRL